MKTRYLGFAIGIAAGFIGFSGAVLADGKATFDSICSDCHEADDFEGESVDELKETISQIVDGEIDHKKELKLSDQEIADMAAFYSSGGK